MDILSGAWFSFKLIGGRYPALQPCLWSFRSIVSSVTSRGLILQRPGWSCLVLSCLIVQMSPDILKDGQEWFDVTDNNRHKKSSFSTLCWRGGVFWSECLMVSKTSQSHGCEPRAEWSSLNSLSEHLLIHTDVPTCSDRYSSEIVCDEFAARHINTSTLFCTSVTNTDRKHYTSSY